MRWTGLGGIHSPYEPLRGQNINANVSTCNPSKFWMSGRHGYGKPEYRRLYENLLCFPLQDMLLFIQSNDVNDHKATIFKGHISQFLILLHFEVFAGDAPLTRHNFAQQTQRVWRSTKFFPRAANLAVIRYE